MSSRESFEAALDADPSDHSTRAVYADWLEENGDVRMAEAIRWMSKHNVAPYVSKYRVPGKWTTFGVKYFDTRAEAEIDLVLELIRNTYNENLVPSEAR